MLILTILVNILPIILTNIILQCGEDGVAQFLAIKDARKKMGHFPITQMAINPQECTGNKDILETLERGSRVHLLFDNDGAIVDTLYGSTGDVLFYSKERVLDSVLLQKRRESVQLLLTNQNSLFRSRDWISANQGPGNWRESVQLLLTNQNSLFRSCD
eukprot:sb/3472997/